MRENKSMNPADRSGDKARVIDLNSYRNAKVRVEPEEPSFTKHADEAMALGNSAKAPAAKHGPVRRGLKRVEKALGMESIHDE
jgi:hypothetical protein